MEQLGVMIRKWEYNTKGCYYNVSKRNLNKQIKTLFKKLKKKFPVLVEYSVEKDKNSNKYHSHLIIHHHNNQKRIFEILMKFIGGEDWEKRKIGLEVYDECNGKYGLIHIQDVYQYELYKNYINKYGELNTLF